MFTVNHVACIDSMFIYTPPVEVALSTYSYSCFLGVVSLLFMAGPIKST